MERAVVKGAVVGVDAHKHSVTLAVLSATGGEIGIATFESDVSGLEAAARWLSALSAPIERIGIEGAGSWGRHIAIRLAAAGYDVREVPPARTAVRRRHRRRPKTDREDALAVAREALADEKLPPAIVGRDGSAAQAELTISSQRRRSLIRRRQRLLNEAEGVLNKLPLEVAAALPGRATVAARLRALANNPGDVAIADTTAREQFRWLQEMAADLIEWEARIEALEARLPALLAAHGSTLTEETGIGVVSAAELVAEIGNPDRFPSEAAFARWCGAAPIAVSSGEGDGAPRRHRLDLFGNRAVNRVLHIMSVTQARYHDAARTFLARKRTEGKSRKEARRAHKRQLANRIIRRMWKDARRSIEAGAAVTNAAA